MPPDAVATQSIRRVLVTKLRHHGDVLLASPVFQALRRHLPHAELDALVYADTRALLEEHPAIAQVHAIDRRWKDLGPLAQARQEWALLAALSARRYQLIVHLTDHWRGWWLAQALRPRHAVAPARASAFWAMAFSHRFPMVERRHTVEANLDALRRLGLSIEAPDKRLVLVPGAQAEEKVSRLLSAHGLAAKGYLHAHPTSRWLFKAWTEAKNAELLAALVREGHRVVVTSAPDGREMAMVRRILEQAGGGVVDLSGQLTLRELAALSARARLFVGVDSAPMHIASAMGTPVVALFGPSCEATWGPWSAASRVVASAHPCRPCQRDGCGGSKVSDCLVTLEVERVRAAVNELLAQP